MRKVPQTDLYNCPQIDARNPKAGFDLVLVLSCKINELDLRI